MLIFSILEQLRYFVVSVARKGECGADTPSERDFTGGGGGIGLSPDPTAFRRMVFTFEDKMRSGRRRHVFPGR